MLKLQEVNFSYDNNRILHKVNLSLESGKICTIVGRSGVGKTTLLKLMSGIYQPEEGQLTIYNETLDPKQHNIAYVPQNYGLIPWFHVKKNILLPRKLKNGKNAVDEEELLALCQELRIDHIMKKYPAHISGGQMQRVAIGRALYQEPHMLLMDEPFSSLDHMHRDEARHLFLKVWEKHQITTVIVTHDLLEAIYLGHHVAILREDKQLKLYDNPYYHKVLEDYLQDIYRYKKQLEEEM